MNNWCMCPGDREVEQAYQEDRLRILHSHRTQHSIPPPKLAKNVSSHQFTTTAPPTSSPQLEKLRNRNIQFRDQLNQRRQILWDRANQLERRSQTLRLNYIAKESDLRILIGEIDKHF